MKKELKYVLTITGVILLVGIVLTNTSASVGHDPVWIDENKNGVFDDGEWNGTSINDAIDNASSGDTIIVEPGIYRERVMVNKELKIIGDPTLDGYGGTGWSIKASNVLLQNWTIYNCSRGIHIYNSTDIENITVDNCTIHSSTGGDSYGIFIGIGYVRNSTVNNTKISDASKGIYIAGCDYINITNCQIWNNTRGIKLFGADHTNITSNTIYKNTNGIYVEPNSDNNSITLNKIYNNTWGIDIDTSCSNNLIYNNYFDNNPNNALDDGGTNSYNITKTLGTNILGGPYLGGNFWDDYTGLDNDGDGLGDTPYAIPGGSGNQTH